MLSHDGLSLHGVLLSNNRLNRRGVLDNRLDNLLHDLPLDHGLNHLVLDNRLNDLRLNNRLVLAGIADGLHNLRLHDRLVVTVRSLDLRTENGQRHGHERQGTQRKRFHGKSPRRTIVSWPGLPP